MEKEVKYKKDFLIVISAIIFIGFLVFVLAATTMNLPVTKGNYSTTLTINISVDANGANNMTNVTCYYNASGGAATVFLTQILNESVSDLDFTNSTINISAFTDATTYNLSCSIRNGTYLNQTISRIITIDNAVPVSLAANISLPAGDYYNYSGIIILNITPSDATSGVASVVFNITNSSGVQNATVTASLSGSSWNGSFNTATVPDGLYNITAYVTDYAGNSNKTAARLNVIFDNTAPTGTVTCTPANVVSGNTVTCSCSPSDATSGINSSATAITANPSTANTGTYTSSCSFADLAGNTGSSSGTYIVEQGGGVSSSGSGSGTTSTSSYSKTIPQNSEEFSEIQTIETSGFSGGGLGAKERIKIKINNEEHYVGVKSIKDSKVTIEIASEPVEKELAVGEETKVDVDNDGYYDIYVKLNNIVGTKADVTIRYLHEAISSSSAETDTNAGATADNSIPEKIAEKINSTWVLAIILGIIILIIIWFIIKKR